MASICFRSLCALAALTKGVSTFFSFSLLLFFWYGHEKNDESSASIVNVAAADYNVPLNFASGPGKRKRQDEHHAVPGGVSSTAATSSQQPTTTSSSSATYSNYSASSAGVSVQRSDVSTLGQSYSHNFQLHQQDWIAQRRDERQSEIDTLKAQQQQQQQHDNGGGGGGGGGDGSGSGGRMGFEMARKLAKGESIRPSNTRGPNGESLKNEWDRKQGGGSRQYRSDDRVYKQFISSQRNRR